jgi:hypothetical protein
MPDDTREDVLKLLDRIEAIVPFITSTIDPKGGNTIPTQHNSEWIEVHRGRAWESTSKLKRLLRDAQTLKTKLR